MSDVCKCGHKFSDHGGLTRMCFVQVSDKFDCTCLRFRIGDANAHPFTNENAPNECDTCGLDVEVHR